MGGISSLVLFKKGTEYFTSGILEFDFEKIFLFL